MTFDTGRRLFANSAPACHGVLVALAIILLFPVQLVAQQDQEPPKQSLAELGQRVRPGDTLRVHQKPTEDGTTGNIVIGTLSSVSVESSTLVLDAGEATIRFDEKDLEKIELASSVTGNHGVAGAAIGAGAGFGIVAVMIVASCGQPDCGGGGYAFSYGALLGAPIGALIGYAVGRNRKTEDLRWDPVFSRPSRPWLSFFPILTKDKKGAALRLSF